MVYEPETQQWDGKGSLLEYVKDKNLNRRQLSIEQKAMVAARMKPLYESEARIRKLAAQNNNTGKEIKEQIATTVGNCSRGTAAEIVGAMMGVCGRSVERASKILKHGSSELIKSVEQEGMPIRPAAEIAKLPKSEQPVALAEYRDKKANTESKPKEHKTSRADVKKENEKWLAEHPIHELTAEEKELDDMVTEMVRATTFSLQKISNFVPKMADQSNVKNIIRRLQSFFWR